MQGNIKFVCDLASHCYLKNSCKSPLEGSYIEFCEDLFLFTLFSIKDLDLVCTQTHMACKQDHLLAIFTPRSLYNYCYQLLSDVLCL